MPKTDLMKKISELRQLQRTMEDIAQDLGVGDITEDKIYIAISAYRATLEKVLREELTSSTGE